MPMTIDQMIVAAAALLFVGVVIGVVGTGCCYRWRRKKLAHELLSAMVDMTDANGHVSQTSATTLSRVLHFLMQ